MTRPRLLLVEDTPDDAELVLFALRRAGVEPAWERVETAEGLRAALAAGPWDAVLSDYTLPGFGAAAALGIVRAHDPDLPFLVVSGAIGEDAAVAVMQAGANDYLLKHALARLAPALDRDIREAASRRARRAAERAAAHLAAVVESSEDAIMTKTLDGVITSWNAAAEQLYGWPAAEAVGQHVSFLVPPDRAAELAAAMGRLRGNERVESFETVRTHRDGRPIDVSLRLSPVRGAGGEVVGVSKSARDIRERKRAEAALRHSEERYRGLIESIPALVWVYDPAGKPLLHNRRWFDYTGQSRDEVAANRWHEALHPDDIPATLAAWNRSTASGEPYVAEYRIRRHDGAYRWFLAQGTAQRGPGGIEQWVGICTDIDERKQASEELRRTTALLREVTDGTPDAVFVKDRAGRYLLFNPAASRFVGVPAEAVLGRDDTALFGPADARLVMDRDRRVMGSGEVETHEEELTAAGATRTYLATKIPYRDAEGNVLGTIGISRDITEQKAAADAVRASEERFRAFMHHSPATAFIKDEAGRYLYANPAWRRQFGPGPLDWRGKTDYDLWPRETADHLRASDARCLAEGVAVQSEETGRVADGEALTWAVMKFPLGDGGERRIGGIAWDITDRKRAERARAERVRLASLVGDIGVALNRDSSTADMLRRCAEAVVRHLDAAFARIWTLGAGGDVLELQASAGMYTHLDGPHGRVPVGEFKIGRITQERRPHVTNDVIGDPRVGDQEWARREGMAAFAGYPLLAGDRLVGVLAMFARDPISEATVLALAAIADQIALGVDRKRGEGELRLFRALIDRTTDGVEVIDPATGRFLDANERACANHGYTREEYLGLCVRDIDPLVAASERGWEGVKERHRAGFHTLETRHRRKDGSTFPVEVSLNYISVDRDYYVAVVRDITERKRAEDAVRTSEQRYRTLVAATSAMVWDTPASGEFEAEQPGWTAFTGQAFDRLRGWGWLDAVHPDDRAETARVWTAATASRGVYEVEHRLRRADGGYRHMAVRAVPILDRGGAIREWVGVHMDITDRKRAEVERAELVARLSLQIERMPLAYLLLDADFRFTRWNPAAERTFGFAEAEVLGRTPFESVVPPHARASTEAIFARLAAGDMDAHGQADNLTRDGRTITCEWYNTPLFGPDGTFQGVLSLAQDVTARRDAEQALRLRDRAIQVATQGLVISDFRLPDQPVTYFSPGFERMTGYGADEVIGRNCRFLQGKDTDRAAVAQLRRAVRAGEPCTVEFLNYRKDGTPFWNELSIAPVRDDTGRLTHYVGVQSDVTARRDLEEQFRQAQKMEAVGRLAGGIAHDFNNLLTIINGYSSILLEDLPPTDPSRDLVVEIHDAGERSAGLTRQLLAFSRKQVLAPRVLDLNDVVAATDKMLRRLLGSDVKLSTAPDPDLAAVRADPGQVEQVLMNLAVNARDAMPGGGQLTIRTRNAELDAAYVRAHPDARPGPHVLLSVADTGGGMTPEVKARVFEPFFTTKGPGKGTGLGLATVYGIVKQSGGHVALTSELGVGTTFEVYLPRSTKAATENGTARAGHLPPPRGTETILLAEDDAGVRSLTRHVLAGCGYTVVEAGDADEAGRVAAGHPGPLHLLVTDVIMPGGGGRAAAERVAGHHPGARVLFVSGYTDDAVLRHGVLRERVNFLQKPFTPAALALKVREVLDAEARPADSDALPALAFPPGA